MTIAALSTLLLVIITFTLHYFSLLGLSKYLPNNNVKKDRNVLIIVGLLFLVHIVEISLYGVAYYVSIEVLDLGDLKGAVLNTPMAYFYYSGVVFTTLGLGDVYPSGHIQVMSMIESLNGFLLITWSASYTFLAMSRLWRWQDCCD